MKIGTIIILENLNLQKVINNISGGLSQDDDAVEFFIGNFILNDPNNTIGKCPLYIKTILNKYRTLILRCNSNEEAMKLLVKNWNQYFELNLDGFIPYKEDFENIVKLVNTGKSVLDIFVAIGNGMNAIVVTHKLSRPFMWKTNVLK